MSEHLPECPVENRLRAGRTVGSQTCICDALRACEHRVRQDEQSSNFTFDEQSDGMTEAYRRGLDAAREAIAETHLPIPVIQCECGWGANCPECGLQSNRIVGSVCRICCDYWGDHGYCDDMHNEDDTPVHHISDEMWSGPYCPVLAAIDEMTATADPVTGASPEHAVECDAPVYASGEGQWVTYADHAAEIRACEDGAREQQCLTCCTRAKKQYVTEYNAGHDQGYKDGYSAAMDDGWGKASKEPTPGPIVKIDRWGASGRTGLPDTMPNGEWVKYKDHIEVVNACQQKTIDGAIKRVAALPDLWPNTATGIIRRADATTAMTGETK